MDVIELYEPKMAAIIGNGLIDMSVFGDKTSRCVEIPMSYCSVTMIGTGPYVDDDVALTLDMKRLVEHGNQHAVLTRHIMLSHCIHRTEDGIFKCHFLDDGLLKGMKDILSAVKEINCGYLELHGDDAIAIRNISRTMRSLKKAWEIVDDRLASKDRGTERNGRDRIEEDQVLQHDMER